MTRPTGRRRITALLMTAKQVGDFLGFDRHTVYDLARRGEIPPPVKIAKRLYFPVRSLVRHLTTEATGKVNGGAQETGDEWLLSEEPSPLRTARK